MRQSLATRLLPLGLVLLAAMLSMAMTCTIGFGSPQPAPFGLNMPWLRQEQYYYCVPASIQMWGLFDNSQFRVSQTTIAGYVHAVPPDGTPALNIPPGVDFYTATKDANLVSAFYTSPAQFASMQITSINFQRPLMAIFNQQHVVVVSGGSWHHDDTSGFNVWDTVIYQDPAGAADSELDASTWQDAVTDMVIGTSASASAQANFKQYGNTVVVRGSIQHGPYQY